jgi:hypothetical protein
LMLFDAVLRCPAASTALVRQRDDRRHHDCARADAAGLVCRGA